MPLRSARLDPACSWSHQTWSDLAARSGKARTLVILPVHGFADHGMGLPLDIEQRAGSALLGNALAASGTHPHVLVLPPFYFGTAPYAHTHFGTDVETALEALMELAASVRASGFSRILFFNTSPWNAELASTAALDSRVTLGLRTYVINASGVGLGFHPADTQRPRTQAIAAALSGLNPAAEIAPARISDAHFRPGNFSQPAPVRPDASLSGQNLVTDSVSRLSDLLREVVAHDTTLTLAPGADSVTPAPSPVNTTGVSAGRYLTAMTAAQLAAIQRKEHALVILPTGAIEQHGHHLPVGTDAFLGEIWLDHALPKLAADAPVYVAPALLFGKSNEHLGFAGTLSFSAKIFRRQLLAAAAQLKALGFRQLAILNTHGGNSATLVPVLREIQTTLGLRAGMLGGHYQPEQSPRESGFGFHAGEWETSLLLAAMPVHVHMDRAVREYPAGIDAPGNLRMERAPSVFAWQTKDVSQSGVIGDATLATPEKGARWLEEASTALARKIESLLSPA